MECNKAKYKHNSHSILHHAPSSSYSRHLLLNFEVDQDLTPLESILKMKNVIECQSKKKKWKSELTCEGWWWEMRYGKIGGNKKKGEGEGGGEGTCEMIAEEEKKSVKW